MTCLRLSRFLYLALCCSLHKHFGQGCEGDIYVCSCMGYNSEAQYVKEKVAKILWLMELVRVYEEVLECDPLNVFAPVVLEDRF